MGSGGLLLLLGLLLLSAELAPTHAEGRAGYCLHLPRPPRSPSGVGSCTRCAMDEDCPPRRKCCGSECGNTCQAPDPNRCRLPADNGPCKGYMPQFFYKWRTKRCEKFIYGGCHGNMNRFSTVEECQLACGSQGTLSS